jgi:hypothetical protein
MVKPDLTSPATSASTVPAVDVDAYNQRGIRALEQARKARGVRSAESFARLLADRTGGSPSSSTYHRWLRGEAPIPLWIVLAAAEESQQSLDTLLADAELPVGVLSRLDHIEDLLGVLQAQMIEVRERVGLPWHGATDEAADEHPGGSDALP